MRHGKDLAALTGGTLLVGEELPPSGDPRSPLKGNCRIRLGTGFREFKEVQPLWSKVNCSGEGMPPTGNLYSCLPSSARLLSECLLPAGSPVIGARVKECHQHGS